MKQFHFWYTETDTYRAYFEAATPEEARTLLDKVRNGEISTSDLPNFEAFGKDYEIEIYAHTLKEVGEN